MPAEQQRYFAWRRSWDDTSQLYAILVCRACRAPAVRAIPNIDTGIECLGLSAEQA
jgi:hypothetical protein